MKKSKLILPFLLLIGFHNVRAYDVVDRYKLINDKLKTEDMLRPFGHDFLLDTNVSINKNVMDFADEIEEASKKNSDSEKINAANTILAKYNKTEQSMRLNTSLGIPLFSFTAFDVKISPNIRANVDFGTNLGIRSELLTEQQIIDLFADDLPSALVTQIKSAGFFSSCAAATSDSNTYGANGCDVIQYCRSMSDTLIQTFCNAQPLNRYVFPTNQAVPQFDLFAKLDAKVGLFNDFTSGEHFFGFWNLYGLSRTDIFQKVTAQQVASGQEIELPSKKNTENTLQTDFKMGYKNANYTAGFSVEEVKISKMKERDTGSKELSYGYDPLIRFHADANFKYSIVSLQPFAGFHKRSGYGFGDGVYAGADAGAHVWGDRIGLTLRAMLDQHYMTLTPRIKLWLMQLEYSLKNPLKDNVDDTKLSAIHSIDFRLFF